MALLVREGDGDDGASGSHRPSPVLPLNQSPPRLPENAIGGSSDEGYLWDSQKTEGKPALLGACPQTGVQQVGLLAEFSNKDVLG
jgi:hypothetical protein